MIKFDNITTECFKSVSFEIKKGSVCKIITNSDYEKKKLLDVIFASQKPMGGNVFLFGRNIYAMSEKEFIIILKKIGVVLKEGGIISNLKVWENITLPVFYHMRKVPKDLEKRVIDIFNKMGKDINYISEFMGKLSGILPVNEKKLVGLVRAMIMEPKLIIYDSIFEGLSLEMAEKFVMLTTKFHSEEPKRTSVYISTEESFLKDIRADIVFRQYGKGFVV